MSAVLRSAARKQALCTRAKTQSRGWVFLRCGGYVALIANEIMSGGELKGRDMVIDDIQ